MDTKSAVGYIRVSTEEQAREGVSLDAQKERLGAWATANGYALAAVHVDAGLSGRRADNRPGLQAAIVQACELKAVLVVYSLSRLARSTRDAIAISSRLDKAGADLVSLSEKIDTTSASGKMIFRLMAVLAEFESDLIGERTASALAFKRGQGEAYGPTPFGFQRQGSRLERDSKEAEALSLVARMRRQGKSLRAIAADLTRRGVATKRGGTWAAATIRRLLSRIA